jgi:hypothetical protein
METTEFTEVWEDEPKRPSRLVKEKGPRTQTSRFEPVVNKSWEYNDRTDSYQEVPKDYIGTAKKTIEIVRFGEGVAQPGPYQIATRGTSLDDWSITCQ